MRVILFYHSLVSDWNHGNAHFLRGVVSEMLERGWDARVYEPADGWSRRNLLADQGQAGVAAFQEAYPRLRTNYYDLAMLDLDEVLRGADLVLVHEWNPPALIEKLGAHRARHGGVLLFHDTHHRALTASKEIARLDLRHYDGVLAFGAALAERYRQHGWADRVWTWHEAADTRVFRPRRDGPIDGDLVWIGNWGDGEREAELEEFLLKPVKDLGLKARVYGVRYPQHALAMLRRAGIEYAGWLPNSRVPEVFGRYRVTVHVPRRPYVEALPGIPTIRVFEALACGIPLVCSPWQDVEHLFTPGKDFLQVNNGTEMKDCLRRLLDDEPLARKLAEQGRRTVLERHTCRHRVDELCVLFDHVARPRKETAPLAANGNRARLRIAFFGSSLVSAYWNGAATYYRGLVKALHKRGHQVNFFEPDAYDRQRHRDIADPDWAKVVVYSAEGNAGVLNALEQARGSDVVIVTSGIGVFDEFLQGAVLELKRPGTLVAFWDVDAPATLERVQADAADPFRAHIPRYDCIFTYGGGDPVVRAYLGLGARECIPIYNAVDPETHFPVAADARFESDLAFLGNRLPDREARVGEFFLRPASTLPEQRFLLAGNGWHDKPMSGNVRCLGHMYTRDHNAFNCTPRAVLNVCRDSMARFGYSPATRVFEAAGAAACIITDAWPGVELFLTPQEEILVAANGDEVVEHLGRLDRPRARALGEAARRRVLAEHTYDHRAEQVEKRLM